jgi:hypothetical protein
MAMGRKSSEEEQQRTIPANGLRERQKNTWKEKDGVQESTPIVILTGFEPAPAVTGRGGDPSSEKYLDSCLCGNDRKTNQYGRR